EVGRLVFSGPARWPRLLRLIRQYRTMFLTWSTVLPAVLALFLSLLQLAASRQIWPQATLTVGDLGEVWVALVLLAPLALAMLAVDVYCAWDVGYFDRMQLEKHF